MSAAIPQGMLAALRGAFETSLPRTCTVSTPGAATGDDYGGTGGTPTTVSGVKCSFMERAAYERMVGGALAAGGDVVMTFEADASLSAAATVTVDADEEFDEPAETFHLVGMISGPPRNVLQLWTAKRG